MVVMTLSFIICHLSFSHAVAQRYVGADMSMLLKYEEQDATYFDKDGQAISDVLAFVKEQGWNTVRVRLFDDPSRDADKAVCQDLEYVKTLGKRIKDAGMKFLLDIHYSDTWADPGKQTFPSAWSIYSWTPQNSVYKYTKDWLEKLVEAGATPDFIQTGNEISFGMLWGFYHEGKYEDWDEYGGHLEATADWTDYTDKHWDNFANMLKSAGKACREICPNAKIIIHTEQCANNPTLDVAFFKHLQKYGIDYDIIGTSYYPYYKGPLSNLDNGFTQLEKNFPDKEIQLVETGYPSKWAVNGTNYDYSSVYPYSQEGQRKYTADLITMLLKHKQVDGLSWWYAEANAKGCTGNLASGWYNAGLFDNETGKALPALYELKNFVNESAGINGTTIQQHRGFAIPDNSNWYTLIGHRLSSTPVKEGIYIKNGNKAIVK